MELMFVGLVSLSRTKADCQTDSLQRTEASEGCVEGVLDLAIKYLDFLAGGPQPDDETWWNRPKEAA